MNTQLRGGCGLRSTPIICLEYSVQTSIGQRRFACYGPTDGNCLPSALFDNSISLNTFGLRLKAYLFRQLSTPSDALLLWCFCGAICKLHDVLTYLHSSCMYHSRYRQVELYKSHSGDSC